MSHYYSALAQIPASDENFKTALADAPIEVLNEALEARAQAKSKTAFRALRSEIHRRYKEAGDGFEEIEDFDAYRKRIEEKELHDGYLLKKSGAAAKSEPVTLARLDAMPVPAAGHSTALCDMSVDQLGEAFAGLEAAQAQGESMSGMCATLAGLVLREVKKKVEHGKFQTWLKEHFPKSVRTARGYMQLAGVFTKTAPRCRFEQLTLALLDNATSTEGHSLDFSHPTVKQVSKWTKGRSFYQLRLEELVQGGNNHPKCPHCEGDLASLTQETCPHCGKQTGQVEKTPEEIRAELTEHTRVWAHELLNDSRAEKKMYKLLPDHEAGALATHLRSLAQEIDAWVKTPARRRQEMTIEEVLA